MGAHLKVREASLTFRRKNRHGLSKLLASLTKESENAVDVLVALMKNQDDKIKLQAASKLLDMQRAVAEDIEKDDITRTMLELKNPDRNRQLVMEEDDTPMVDFTTIQDID